MVIESEWERERIAQALDGARRPAKTPRVFNRAQGILLLEARIVLTLVSDNSLAWAVSEGAYSAALIDS